MCGIYGMITGKDNYDIKYNLFRELAIATEVRGKHATGFAYSDGKRVRYHKEGIPASQFVLTGEFEDILKDKPNMIIGHNRYSTHGDPKDNRNNHPFKSHSLQFIHNGVIQNYEELKKEYRCYSECDSEVILRIIDKSSTRIQGIQQVYKEVKGSMACMLMDTQKLRLWIWRNYGNPIFMSWHEELGLQVFCSTRTIFDIATKSINLTTGWDKGYFLSDEEIHCYKFHDNIISPTVYNVKNVHIDPSKLTILSDDELDGYLRYYNNKRRLDSPNKAYGSSEHYKLRDGYWDSDNHCWVVQ